MRVSNRWLVIYVNNCYSSFITPLLRWSVTHQNKFSPGQLPDDITEDRWQGCSWRWRIYSCRRWVRNEGSTGDGMLEMEHLVAEYRGPHRMLRQNSMNSNSRKNWQRKCKNIMWRMKGVHNINILTMVSADVWSSHHNRHGIWHLDCHLPVCDADWRWGWLWTAGDSTTRLPVLAALRVVCERSFHLWRSQRTLLCQQLCRC